MPGQGWPQADGNHVLAETQSRMDLGVEMQ